ncbi:MAG: hypothetical protein JST30_05925 [Armatimonadetes bacterium]|nr:hypothetical protein [Armatimonadota bacterium]
MSNGRKVAIGVGALIVVLVGTWLFQVAQAAMDAKKAGLLDDVATEKYQVGRENNLKAIQASLLLSAESEGKLPDAGQWMDQALIRLKTSDLTEAEAKDKLRVPGRGGLDYGYAVNDKLAGKPLDVKAEAETVLVFESRDASWNAHGDPDKDAATGGKGVTVSGKVVPVGR